MLLKVQQIIALVLMISGVLLMFAVVQGDGQAPESLAAVARYAPHLMGVGAVWYVIIRVLMLLRRRR